MGDTLKLRDFCEHPITNRAVGDVPGVGPVAARKLTSRGYFKAQDLYEKLKKQGFDENKFRVWITINALGAKSSVIYRALMMWDRQFNGHAEDSDSASTSQSAARESASAQRKKFQFRKSTPARDSNAEGRGINVVSNNAMSLFFASCADSNNNVLPEFQNDMKLEILSVVAKFENLSRQKTATAKPSTVYVLE